MLLVKMMPNLREYSSCPGASTKSTSWNNKPYSNYTNIFNLSTYEGHPINKLQNGIILLIFKIGSSRYMFCTELNVTYLRDNLHMYFTHRMLTVTAN